MGRGSDFGDDLRRTIKDAARLFAAADPARAAHRPSPGKWCAGEVLGHLIDSAANNHRRFIVGQSDPSQTFDTYAQVEWVERGQYNTAEWQHLVTLWTLYNQQLARVMDGMSDEALQSERLRFLVEDYIRHLRHHIEQIRVLLASC